MDLASIKRKLDTGQYKDPWDYVDDVWLMFDNAWLYNRKTSRVYKYCTKVCSSVSHFGYKMLYNYRNHEFPCKTKFKGKIIEWSYSAR
jgi:hypothetical protein